MTCAGVSEQAGVRAPDADGAAHPAGAAAAERHAAAQGAHEADGPQPARPHQPPQRHRNSRGGHDVSADGTSFSRRSWFCRLPNSKTLAFLEVSFDLSQHLFVADTSTKIKEELRDIRLCSRLSTTSTIVR